jgi:hypothetical protein
LFLVSPCTAVSLAAVIDTNIKLKESSMIQVMPAIYKLGSLLIINSLVSKVIPEYIKYCDHEKERNHEKLTIGKSINATKSKSDT